MRKHTEKILRYAQDGIQNQSVMEDLTRIVLKRSTKGAIRLKHQEANPVSSGIEECVRPVLQGANRNDIGL